MLGLGQTTAKLARYRRQWNKFLASAKSSAGAEGGAPRTTILPEQTGFGSNPGNLRMFTYVPAHLQPGAPLVVALHGCAQTAGGYDFGTGWSVLADRFGFAVLLPEQKRTNNPNTCFTWFAVENTMRDRGEALSIRQMIAYMETAHGIDRNRIYATGLSAGGAMTSVMLATYPEVFAGGAIIAGLPYGSATNVQEAFDAMFQGKVLPARAWGDLVRAASPHAGPWPKVSVWHGDADQTVKPANADEIIKQWVDVHGLSAAPSLEMGVDGHRRRVWRDAAGETMLEAYTIAGMAHGAPIDAAAACGHTAPFFLDAGISSTYRIAEFWGLTAAQAAESAERDLNGRRSPRSASGRPTSTVVIDQDGRVLDAEPDRAAESESAGEGNAADKGDWRSQLDPSSVITKALRAAGLMK
ncbi:MAG TPA: PHB depolymerase family esterase [Alphaproteobacteria bacterium]|nr:PHB depolymerase family esterase [Alphaproteobacteria bacterium]